MEQLHQLRRFRICYLSQFSIICRAGIQAIEEFRVVHIQNHREDAARRLISLANHINIVVPRIQTETGVEVGPLDIVEEHSHKHRQQEEAGPQLSFPVVQHLGLSFHHRIKEVAMTVFVLTPVFKEAENRINPVFWVRFQVTIDGDVTPVADFFRQIGGVEDVFRINEGLQPPYGQKAQDQRHIDVRHRLIEETGVAGFIPGHQVEAFSEDGIFVFDATAQFFVEQETGEFSGAGPFEKLDE